MKHLVTIVLAITFSCFFGCQTQEKDRVLSQLLDNMGYGDILLMDSTVYQYLLVRMEESKPKGLTPQQTRPILGKDVLLGEETFTLWMYNDTAEYRYQLQGKRYNLFVKFKDMSPGAFAIKMTWTSEQDKYHGDSFF